MTLTGEDEPTILDVQPDQARDSGQEIGHRRRGKRRVRAVLVVAGLALVGGAAGAVAVGVGGSEDAGVANAPSGPPSTARIVKRTLAETETVSGSLGFGDINTLTPSAGQAGTITWLPSAGQTIERGKQVYAVDARKVPLFYGSVPLYRVLDPGAEGKDVRMLEANLKALGYDGFTADNEYTWDTATAVKEWQEDLGSEQTGTVSKGDVFVAPGKIRIADVTHEIGDAATGSLLTWTGTRRIVTVDLEADYEDLVSRGTKAEVKLPNGRTLTATVTSIGTTAQAQTQQSATGTTAATAEDAVFPVKLEVKDQKNLGRYQSSPVDVTLTAEQHKDVLAVPITALVALREGGYAVETVQQSGASAYVAVRTGVFANGLVEISGSGLAEGMTVGVPK